MKKTIPHILMITHGLGLEGAPRSFAIVAKGLAESGSWRVTVFSHREGPLRDELETAGIRVLIAPTAEVHEKIPTSAADLETYCRENLRFLALSSKLVWEDSLKAVAGYIHDSIGSIPNLVLSNTVLGFWGLALAHMWNLPSVWCIHESEAPFSHLKWLPDELFDLLPNMLAHASQVVFAAKATEDVFTQAGYRFRSTIIPYGLPLDMPIFTAAQLDRKKVREVLGITDDSICFLALGSVFERKGQTDICRAMGLLPSNLLEKMNCHIVGDRPETAYSKVLHDCIDCLSEPARKSLRVFPETKDTAPHYRAADAFVMCSRMESYPFVILEAMSLGLPIIATPVFGIKEQLTDHAALFYEPGDIETLAEHIGLLVENGDTRRSFGHRSQKEYLQLPSYTEMTEAYLSVIMECWRGDGAA